ncbi:MAG: helix-turn-helix transcriptional regulator [Bacteroidales bacterium]|nr:helix-turn-helix transcriptional regulator [Bacteroidales bacterium]
MIDVNRLLSNNVTSQNFLDEEEVMGIIAGVKACSIANNLSSVVVDFDKHRTVFMSDNLLYLDEATISDFKRTSENPYWALVSEDVLDVLIRIHDDYSKLRNAMSEEEYRGHVCTMDYPIIIKGREFYINSRFIPLRMRAEGITNLGLFTFVPSNRKEMTFIVKTPSGKRWTYDFSKGEFKQFDLALKLSITEKAILQRARKGLSNEEIAKDLFLSLNTIKSHRLHIFKKLNVTTITEALLVIGNYQLL